MKHFIQNIMITKAIKETVKSRRECLVKEQEKDCWWGRVDFFRPRCAESVQCVNNSSRNSIAKLYQFPQ